MTTAAILQPHYLPYSGFFKLVRESDIFIFFDNVQFEARSWQNRNKIKTPEGFKWLTVPVVKSFGQLIKDIKINNSLDWQQKHWKAIVCSYSKAPFFKDYKDFFEEVYSRKWDLLVDLNIYIIQYLAKELGLKTKFIKASELDVSGKRSELLANICKKVKADKYYSNIGSKDYMDKEMHFFDDAGIKVSYLEYSHPIYPQLFGEFISHLSVIDVLFNNGKKTREIILGEKDGKTSN